MSKKNIAVIGDLVVDETIFVRDKPSRQHQSMHGEQIFEVLDRNENSGGAANTARIIASISDGTTWLFGAVGSSHWGTYSAILASSQRSDGARRQIVFRDISNEAGGRLHTISRVMTDLLEARGVVKRRIWLRYDSFELSFLPKSARKQFIEQLDEIHRKEVLSAIVMNDYDLNCFTVDFVRDIAKFCESQSPPIPLFVDPKFDVNKYDGIRATAILPNLDEWLNAMDQAGREEAWKAKVATVSGLIELAQLSLMRFGNFRYQVIKMDRDGLVVVCPHPTRTHYCAVYRALPSRAFSPEESMQLGAGDALIGSLAHDYAADDEGSGGFLVAIAKAKHVSETYLEQRWMRMPSMSDITRSEVDLAWTTRPAAELPIGSMLLPKSYEIKILDTEIVAGLYTFDEEFSQRTKAFIADCLTGWNPRDKRSLILAAPPGSGKSSIISHLKSVASGEDYVLLDISEDWEDILTGDTVQRIELLSKKVAAGGKRIDIVVDEAVKAGRQKELRSKGVLLLERAHQLGIRFIFLDASFYENDNLLGKEITTRCKFSELPGLERRLQDIPLILAGRVFSTTRSPSFTISATALLAFVNQQLVEADASGEYLSPRSVVNAADLIIKAINSKATDDQPFIDIKHLPKAWRWERHTRPMPDSAKPYVFTQ